MTGQLTTDEKERILSIFVRAKKELSELLQTVQADAHDITEATTLRPGRKIMNKKPIAAGKQSGTVLCFLRSRILRHEIHDEMSVALLPFMDGPDRTIRKGEEISPDELATLRRDYVLCRNPLGTYVDTNGGRYFAIPVSTVTRPRCQAEGA